MFPTHTPTPQTTTYLPIYVTDTDAGDKEPSTTVLYPRYADTDTDSSSQSSIEAFEVLDSVAWRQSHTRHLTQKHYKRRLCSRRACHIIIALLLLLTVLLGACAWGARAVIKQRTFERNKQVCAERGGGDRCRIEPLWAECVSGDEGGVEFCEGFMRELSDREDIDGGGRTRGWWKGWV